MWNMALRALGVKKEWIQADLFATRKNAMHPIYIDKDMDVFSFSWDKFLNQPQHVLWANPPSSMLDAVVTKIILEPCRVILTTPDWDDSTWWKPLQLLTDNYLHIPAGNSLFCRDGESEPLPSLKWGTVISLVDSIKWQTLPHSQDWVDGVRKTNQGKTLEDIPPGPRYISVTTTRGTNTEQDEEETSEEEEVGEPSQEQSTQLPSPTTTSPPPKFKFWRQMCPEEQQARKSLSRNCDSQL